jgi:hypothetical protein
MTVVAAALKIAFSMRLWLKFKPHPVAGRTRDHGKAAVGPELPLGTKAVWRDHDRQQQGDAHGPEPGRGLEHPRDAMPMRFAQHRGLCLGLERAELLELAAHQVGAWCTGWIVMRS